MCTLLDFVIPSHALTHSHLLTYLVTYLLAWKEEGEPLELRRDPLRDT